MSDRKWLTPKRRRVEQHVESKGVSETLLRNRGGEFFPQMDKHIFGCCSERGGAIFGNLTAHSGFPESADTRRPTLVGLVLVRSTRGANRHVPHIIGARISDVIVARRVFGKISADDLRTFASTLLCSAYPNQCNQLLLLAKNYLSPSKQQPGGLTMETKLIHYLECSLERVRTER